MVWPAVPERYTEAEVDEAMKERLCAETDTGIYLWGAPGNGKTHSMAWLARHFISEGYRVKRVHYEMLCLQLRDTFKKSSDKTEWSIIQPLLDCDKLFIEDVGTTKSIGKEETDFSRRTFFLLIDVRMERCRPTFITSNKTLENLTLSFDERVGDRLRTFHIFDLGNKSKRQEPTLATKT